MFKSQNAKNGMGANGLVMFCFSEFKVKFETKNGTIFMFRVDKVFHCTMKNQGANQYGMAFSQKNSILNHLKSLNQINILIDFLFEMLFFYFFLKNHRLE
jgi:hypothetical protein